MIMSYIKSDSMYLGTEVLDLTTEAEVYYDLTYEISEASDNYVPSVTITKVVLFGITIPATQLPPRVLEKLVAEVRDSEDLS